MIYVFNLRFRCLNLLFQVRFFCEWMTANKFIVRGRSLINLPIQRLAMPWRDEVNKVDCGVFAMRHMETYMGQRVRDWNIGLMANSAKALQELRVKYCRVLLATEANHVRKTNMGRVVAWFKGFQHVNFNKFVQVLKNTNAVV